jgi:hypothetical protein
VATSIGEPDSGIPRYDRNFLLSPAKRNQIIELWEVEKFGRDTYGDPDAVSLYGMRPAEWYSRGVRILARRRHEPQCPWQTDAVRAFVGRRKRRPRRSPNRRRTELGPHSHHRKLAARS